METYGCICHATTRSRLSYRTFMYLVGGLALVLNNIAGEATNTTTDLTNLLTTLSTNNSDGTGGGKLDFDFQSTKEIWSAASKDYITESTVYWKDGAVCRAKKRNTIRIGNKVKNLEWLKQCSIVEGNLEILWMANLVTAKNYTDVVFPKLVEITGYLILYRVNGLENLGKLFPNLRVIRAQELFYGYGVILYENEDLMSISLPKLSHLGANVAAIKNPQLCYVDDHVNWLHLTPQGTKPKTAFNRDKKGCRLVDGCQDRCEYCWDMDTCQNDCGKCFNNALGYNPGCTPNGKDCCHAQCLGGCEERNNAKKCFACKNIYADENECLAKCPATNSNNETLLELEGRRCITEQECVDYDIFNTFHDGKCLSDCPPNWIRNTDLTVDSDPKNLRLHDCLRCDEECARMCPGGMIQTASDSAGFHGCTIVLGPLEISIGSTPGNLSLLDENLSNIREVTAYVKVIRTKFLQSLNFLKNLRRIRGQRLDATKYAFYIMDNAALEGIWDMKSHPVLTIDEGMMFFQQNPLLCYSKISQLLDTTIFNGTISVTNDTGTTEVRITNATHDKYDVSDETNGQHGNCFNNSLFFEIYYHFDFFPSYNFSAFNTSDQRIIISYILYFREVGPTETASYYRSSCNSNETEWMTLDVEKTEDTEEVDGKKYYSSFITEMLSFTRYAAYVQTYTSLSVGQDGARSKMIYFMTNPSKPDRPRNIEITALSVGEGNVALDVMWDPPELPNGIIEFYNIYYRRIPWNVEHVQRKDHCEYEAEEIALIEEDEKEEATTPAPLNSTCTCEEDEEEAATLSEKEEVGTLLINFENYLQNRVYSKNPDRLNGYGNTRKKRETANNGSEFDVTKAISTTTLPVVTSFASTLNGSSTSDGSNSTTTSTTVSPAQADASETSDKVASMVRVYANQTSTQIFDLEANTQYSIEVVACHAYDKASGKTRCSKRTMSTAITKPDPSLDVINSSTVNIEPFKIDKDKQYLNFSWTPPEKTNGPILTYTVIGSLAEDVNKSQDSLGANFINICIQAKVFSANNNSYKWFMNHKAGSYVFQVRMRTVGTLAGNLTEPVYVQIGSSSIENEGDDMLEKILIPSFVLGLAILTSVIGVLLYKRKKQKPLPLVPLHSSNNMDYMDNLECSYEPDEWELDRSKVKYNETLGQGSFGMVYAGEAHGLYNTDKKMRKVAVKTTNESASLVDRINFLNEASRMKDFKCHHIVQLLGVVSQGHPVLVIMELMALGDLKNYLRMHRPDEPDNDGRRPPTLREILQMAAEIADGMAYLSDKKFVHRDLAARNCMVAQDMTVKIGDFGMTRDVYGADYYRKGGKGMLPVRWMAPESLRDGVYTSKSDVWSYGVVLWEMATLAAQPYQGFSNEEVLKFVVEHQKVMEMPDGCPARLSAMMSQCWQYYPRYRPSFTTLLASLQGDVKKSFFSVSWYYSQRDDDDDDDAGSDSLNIDDQRSESQPLHPGSSHNGSSVHHLDIDDDLDDYEDDLDSAGTANIKDFMMLDTRPPLPMRMGKRAENMEDEYELHNGLMNGHQTSSSEDLDVEDISLHQYPYSTPFTNGGINITAEGHSRAPSSIVSMGRAPPSYNTATLDQSIGAADSSAAWSADAGSTKPSSCNGSANGHLHFGTNTLTSAC